MSTIAGLPEIYLLTNWTMEHGAAGLLQDRMLQEFAGGRNFYILPVTIDEVAFVPDTGRWEQQKLDEMVCAVNQKVDAEDRLSDHSYYYDGEKGEIRIVK